MIERDFDIPFVTDLALREKQIQQNYRPVIAVHKWFARRPGTLFRALLLAEFGRAPLRESFYRSNDLSGLRIADPFMGGGTPLLEANRLGADVTGFDINPMAYWVVKQEIEHLRLDAYSEAAAQLRKTLEQDVGHLYKTRCLECGSTDASVKYFLWVKVHTCLVCGHEFSLFPGYLLAEDKRHPKNVLVCGACGELTEIESLAAPGECHACGAKLSVAGPARRSHCECPHCHSNNTFPDARRGAPKHRMFAIEYHCPACKSRHKGRFFKKPDPDDLARFADAEATLDQTDASFVPDAEIPAGDETDRLHRWGYRRYREMFNARQLLGLELSCRLIAAEPDQRIRDALATNLSDLLRYQNMLCRYDTMALKSLDIFSIHGFPVGLIECESNLLGIADDSKDVSIGSGGWSNIIDKFSKAKSYCDAPFEIRHEGARRIKVPIDGEWIGEARNGDKRGRRVVDLRCENAAEADLSPNSLDAVFTDPPYYGNVQYAELMDFCYVWLRRLVGTQNGCFSLQSTRSAQELTHNTNMGRGLEHFAEGLAEVFKHMVAALKPGAPLAFTYHHNSLEAYLPVAVAILDAGLVCSASLPCPAEMGASIHIRGTGSSIVDTVLVCRTTGSAPRKWIVDSAAGVAALVTEDVQGLTGGELKLTHGDIRCVIYGHLIRLAIWFLRQGWSDARPTAHRLAAVRTWVESVGGLSAVQQHLDDKLAEASLEQILQVRDEPTEYGVTTDEILF